MPFTRGHKINLGRKSTSLTKRLISNAHLGKKLSDEHKQKLSLAKKNRPSNALGKRWKIADTSNMKGIEKKNKGTVAYITLNCKYCKTTFKAKLTEYKRGHGKFCSIICRGKFFTRDNSPSWKGGLTTKNEKARKSNKYKIWRVKVFVRDNYTCQICKKRGNIDLNADHIKPFSIFPSLRYKVENGRTLCVPCHRKTPTFGKGALNYKNNINYI